MRLILEHTQDDVTITLAVGEYSPYFLGIAFSAAEEKFGTIDSGGTVAEEEWALLELNETGFTLQDVAEFIEETFKLSGLPND